jgi:hypothetical protein
VESIRTEREAKRRHVGLRYQLLPAVTAVSIGVPNLTPHRLTVESAERVGRRIVDAYLAPDKTFVELRDMLDTGSIAFSANSVRPAALNSSQCALNNSSRSRCGSGSGPI